MTANTRNRKWRRAALPYVLLTPVFLFYILFWIRPVAHAIVGSLTDASGAFTFSHYLTVFCDPVFLRAAGNTLFIVVVSVTLEFFAAFGLALLINTRFRGSNVFLCIALVPMSLPPVAVGAMWSSGLSTYGWLNSLLCRLGILSEGTRLAFLAGDQLASMLLIILIDAWQVVPFMMVILLAGLQNLSRDFRDAAYVFGAGRLRTLTAVTVPMLRPTIQTALVLRIISAFQIWLIIVMLFGYRRVPVLLEELVYYKEVLTGPGHFKVALAYSVLIAILISVFALLYLKLSTRRYPGHAA